MMSGAPHHVHGAEPYQSLRGGGVLAPPRAQVYPHLGGGQWPQPMVRCQRGGGAPGVAMAVVVAGGRGGGAERRRRWYH